MLLQRDQLGSMAGSHWEANLNSVNSPAGQAQKVLDFLMRGTAGLPAGLQ